MPPDDPSTARRAAIIATARAAFVAHGYGGTSMSAIAATIGGSKTTLWVHFRSKDALFAAVVGDALAAYGSALSSDLPADAPVADTLGRFGAKLMAASLSASAIDLHRLVVGEAARFPRLAAQFRQDGMDRATTALAVFLGGAMADTRLRSGDPLRAARQFVALCQSDSFPRALLSIDPVPGTEEIARDIAAAVDGFVRIWGAA